MKKPLRFLIPLIIVVLAAFLWRWTHPKLSDEDQIEQALNGIATQVSHKSAGGIASYLSKDFQIDGIKKGDIQKQLAYGMLTYASIKMGIAASRIEVNGDTATTKGHYDMGLKREFSSPEQNFEADFSLKWKREDGQWKISNADGNRIPPGLSGY